VCRQWSMIWQQASRRPYTSLAGNSHSALEPALDVHACALCARACVQVGQAREEEGEGGEGSAESVERMGLTPDWIIVSDRTAVGVGGPWEVAVNSNLLVMPCSGSQWVLGNSERMDHCKAA